MIDFTGLEQYFVLTVVLACLIMGYLIKHASFLKFVNNNDIPVILAICGAVTNAIVSGLSVESLTYGALMGLSSTGLYEAFKNFIERENNNG